MPYAFIALYYKLTVAKLLRIQNVGILNAKRRLVCKKVMLNNRFGRNLLANLKHRFTTEFIYMV